MPDKFDRYYAAQSWLVKNPEIFSSTRQRALEIICHKICHEMRIERFGIWMFTLAGDSIFEEFTYKVDGKPDSGKVLAQKDCPSYFEKLSEERVIILDSRQVPPELEKFVQDFMTPYKVCNLLDAPIFSDGKCIGVVCCETTNLARKWDLNDKHFAAVCADFIGRMIEGEKRHNYERELKHRIEYLEKDLHKKIDDIKQSKLSLDLALESAQVGKWDWNIQTGQLSLNKTWYTRLGYEYDEFPQNLETFKKVLHPADVDKTFEALNKHLKGESPFYESRFRMITKSGDIQWCIDRGSVTQRSPDGSPLHATGVNINITAVVQLEQSLMVSERQLMAMINSLPAPVAMFDKNFKYLAYSSRWEQEWKQFGEIQIGHPMSNETNESRDMWLTYMNKALKGETLSQDEDFVRITAELQLWLKWIIQPWHLANGNIGGVVIMAENITHRKETEMKIAQSSKLSALGEMAGGIAHEINNPLSIIKGYIDLLKRHSSRHTLNEDMMLQYIEKMDLTVGRISRIVNGMRRFSRESSMDEKVEYSLNKIIDETLDICLERINNNGTALNVEYFVGDALVVCRPVEISQVILNLINNSFQAISVYPHPWIKIECQEVENYYQIKISDCGPGIPISIRQKLFQPFFTTKDIGVGTGLGLSISRGIIEEHHGQMSYVAEAPNTTFLIQLPKVSKEDN